MNTTTQTDMTVANTILAQLGGNRFMVMTGSKQPMGDASSLTIKIGRGAKDGINCLKVTLDASDTYTMTFYKLGRAPSFKVETVKELDGIYGDSLQDIFTSVTGMYTHL